MLQSVSFSQIISTGFNLANHIHGTMLPIHVEAAHDPPNITDDLISHDKGSRVTQQALTQIPDIMNEVGSVQGCHQGREGILHGSLLIQAM